MRPEFVDAGEIVRFAVEFVLWVATVVAGSLSGGVS